MKACPALLLALLAVARLATAAEDFEQRRNWMLDAVWNDYRENAAKPSAKNAFWRADALFELGKTAEALRLVNRGLDQLVPGNRENRWIFGGNTGFHAWPGLDCYLRHQDRIDAATGQRYREIYTGGAFYQKLSTSNHKIMAAVSRYLATQIWGKDAFRPHPYYTSDNIKATHQGFQADRAMFFDPKDPTGEIYIRECIRQVFRGGPGEYASRPYGAENVLPLLTIAECAADPELRQAAAIAYECCMVQLAPAWLRGHLATFSPRSYPDAESQQPWGIAGLCWVHFGGVPPARPATEWGLRAATSRLRLPDAVLAAATGRDQAYAYRSRINGWALSHFVNRDYALFGRSPKGASRPFQGQSYPCGVMWEEPDVRQGSHLWITNPAADDTSSKDNNPAGLHTHGVTGHEQELQYRDALLFVFRIPEEYRNPYVLGFIPGGHLAARHDRDRLFLCYRSVLVAISSAASFDWTPDAGIRAPATPPRPGDSEFRVHQRLTAIAIETAHPEEFPAASPQERLAAFRKRISEKSRVSFSSSPAAVGSYTDRHGNRLVCTFDGTDSINGQTVDYQNWPVLESPWTFQATPSGPLVLKHAGTTITYHPDDKAILRKSAAGTRESAASP